jgi:hypothetical protein
MAAEGFALAPLLGTPGETFRLETSSDLLNWSSLGLHTFYSPLFPLIHRETTDPLRLYRAAPVR